MIYQYQGRYLSTLRDLYCHFFQILNQKFCLTHHFCHCLYQAGIIRVGGAHLDKGLTSLLNSIETDAKQDALKDMISYRSETKLKEDKQVVDGSLRRLECGIPELELEADIEIEHSQDLSEKWLDSYLSAVCAAVKSIGGNRARGLGKCKITVKGDEKNKVELPEVLKGDVQ